MDKQSAINFGKQQMELNLERFGMVYANDEGNHEFKAVGELRYLTSYIPHGYHLVCTIESKSNDFKEWDVIDKSSKESDVFDIEYSGVDDDLHDIMRHLLNLGDD